MPWKRGQRLALVSEADADDAVRSIYEQVKDALSIPFVPTAFQAFARVPEFLALQWECLKPILESSEFGTLSNRLRADAYTRVHSYFCVPNFCVELASMELSHADLEDLNRIVDLFFWCDASILLVMRALELSFEGPVGSGTPCSWLPQQIRASKCPILVDEQDATASSKRLLDSMRRNFGSAMVEMDYRALSRWPDFLRYFWEVLKPHILSPLYQECQHGLTESASALARELPGQMDFSMSRLSEAGVKEDVVASMVRITEGIVRTQAALCLNISIAKIGMEGGNQAVVASHFSRKVAQNRTRASA